VAGPRDNGLEDAEDAIAVIVAPAAVLPTGTAGGFRLFGGKGAERWCGFLDPDDPFECDVRCGSE